VPRLLVMLKPLHHEIFESIKRQNVGVLLRLQPDFFYRLQTKQGNVPSYLLAAFQEGIFYYHSNKNMKTKEKGMNVS